MDRTADNDLLLIQGDSLPLPNETVPYRRTWPGLLRREIGDIVDVVNRSSSEKTTDDLSSSDRVHHRRELEYYEPRYVILQIGLVDCAPRYFSRFGKEILDLLPSETSSALFFVAKKLRQRSTRRAYVSKRSFRENIEQYLRRASKIGDLKQVVFVEILTASEKYKKKNPNVDESIQDYNEIINAVTDSFDFASIVSPLADSQEEEQQLVDEMTLGDGYHLNSEGHTRMYDRLCNVLNPVDKNRR